MNKFDVNKGYLIAQIVKAGVMFCIGCAVLVPGVIAGGLPVLLFALLWLGLVGMNLVRNVIQLVKHNRDALDDTKQYYAQEDAGFDLTTGEQQGYTTTCPYCGAKVPEVFDYCNACGQKQP